MTESGSQREGIREDEARAGTAQGATKGAACHQGQDGSQQGHQKREGLAFITCLVLRSTTSILAESSEKDFMFY